MDWFCYIFGRSKTTRSPAAVMVVGRRAIVLVASRQSPRVPFELRAASVIQLRGSPLSNVSHMLLYSYYYFLKNHANVSRPHG